MPELSADEKFRRWNRPWKERVCQEVRPFPGGTVLRSRRHPGYWAYNCIRLDRPMDASEMISVADRELADCPHRFVEWTIPMPGAVVRELRELGWLAWPAVFMLHDGRALAEDREEIIEVDYDAVGELRDSWIREDFGELEQLDSFRSEAREVAELAAARVIAAVQDGRPFGFAQVETHDGGSEISDVFVHPDYRGGGIGTALTTRAVREAAAAAPDVWICADRDGRARRLYERLGFRAVVETATAMLPPRPPRRQM